MSEIRSLTDVEHVLHRPCMYTGCDVGHFEISEWLHDGHRCVFDKWSCNKVVRKCIDELLSNAVDNATQNKAQSYISIVTSELGITITNDGVQWKSDAISSCGANGLQTAFGKLRTSSHYGNEDYTAGTFGIGCKLANIFSRIFTVELVDHSGEEIGFTWSSNMMNCVKIDSVDESLPAGSIKVTFSPDETKTGFVGDMRKYTSWLRHRCLEISTFCNLELSVDEFTVQQTCPFRLVEMHQPCAQAVSLCDGVYACILTDHMQDISTTLSLVNGHQTSDNGVHVDQVIAEMHKKMPKRTMPMFQRVVRENVFLFVSWVVQNPVFSSQAKSKLVGGTMNGVEIKDTPESALFFDTLSERLEIECMMKTPRALRRKNVKVDKLQDAILAGGKHSSDCTLILTEGDSAKTFAMSGLGIIGHDRYGVFPLRGKALNARDESAVRIMANIEWNGVLSALGLQLGSPATSSMRYGHVMILADADLDGVHIAGLIINFFASQFPHLLLENHNFIQLFRTPIIKVVNGGVTHECFSMHEFKMIDLHPSSSVKYYKGLGSSTRMEAQEYFKRHRELTRACVVRDADDHDALDIMFSKKKADERKRLIREHISNPRHQSGQKQTSAKLFIHEELLFFSAYDLHRSIPSIMDGLKTSQRKIVYVMQDLKSTKVAQLASTVALKTCYMHGEQSLADCIVTLAQDYVGSNNYPLLTGIGQFGSRLQGGKDAASARYIHVKPSEFMKAVFVQSDRDILDFMCEEGSKVEPRHFVPILPLALINGARGIATGFSTFIPCHDLRDVLRAVRQAILNEPIGTINVAYKGFSGNVKNCGDKWTTHGIVTSKGRDTYHVTELPVYTWTDPFLSKITAHAHKVVSRCDDIVVDITFQTDDITPIQKLLTSQLSMRNMILFDENGILQRYDTSQDIVRHFVAVRLTFIRKRLAFQLKGLNKKKEELQNLKRFLEIIDKPQSLHHFMTDQTGFMTAHGLGSNVLKLPLSDLSSKKLKQTIDAVARCDEDIACNQSSTAEQVYLLELDKLEFDICA